MVTSVAGRVYSVIKSDVGLMIILLAYSFLGAVLLHHAEHDRHQQLYRQLDEHKNRCVADIIDASTTAAAAALSATDDVDGGDWYVNLTATVGALVDVYVEHKEHVRPLSKAPEWTYWGALFFCGTVYTTVGQCQCSAVQSVVGGAAEAVRSGFSTAN